MSAQLGDWWCDEWPSGLQFFCIDLCYGFRRLSETFYLQIASSISEEHSIWSCTGTEAFWQSGGKELLNILLILDMACLIGDISPASDVTKVAGFCNRLLMISFTSSEKKNETDLPIVRISTPLLQ